VQTAAAAAIHAGLKLSSIIALPQIAAVSCRPGPSKPPLCCRIQLANSSIMKWLIAFLLLLVLLIGYWAWPFFGLRTFVLSSIEGIVWPKLL
jgi:hypothetical protein